MGIKVTPTYVSWTGMKQRCDNPKATGYSYYGGRGIGYDPRWGKFAAFHEDMGDRPPDTTLDHIDPEFGYTKDNCRWATDSEQRGNRRPLVAAPGELASSEFRRTYAYLTEVTVVTALGRPIGTWTPSNRGTTHG